MFDTIITSYCYFIISLQGQPFCLMYNPSMCSITRFIVMNSLYILYLQHFRFFKETHHKSMGYHNEISHITTVHMDARLNPCCVSLALIVIVLQACVDVIHIHSSGDTFWYSHHLIVALQNNAIWSQRSYMALKKLTHPYLSASTYLQ